MNKKLINLNRPRFWPMPSFQFAKIFAFIIMAHVNLILISSNGNFFDYINISFAITKLDFKAFEI